jgi:pseudouridine synthase
LTAERLQKLIAAAGLCSRRKAEQLLLDSRVQVNGRIATLGDRADPEQDQICVDGRPLRRRDPARVLLLNKPQGVISSCHDPQGRPTVLDLIPAELRRGLHPVGRLDADSRGALLLTNQGAITLELTHPRYAHRKTYRVWVEGHPAPQILQRWRDGVRLDGLPTQPAEVICLRRAAGRSQLEVILREGRNRQIRRTADLLGHPVLDLQRTAIADLPLGSLPEGHWRALNKREWRDLMPAMGLSTTEPPQTR